jgi:hypothetical protein
VRSFSGKISVLDTQGGGQRFVVRLDKPWQNKTELRFWCDDQTVFLLDGKASTFAEAVYPGRKVEVEHARGATPWVRVFMPMIKVRPREVPSRRAAAGIQSDPAVVLAAGPPEPTSRARWRTRSSR